MLDKNQTIHVSIESPDGRRDWRQCRSLNQVRQLSGDWDEDTIFDIELVDYGINLTMTVTKFGTLA